MTKTKKNGKENGNVKDHALTKKREPRSLAIFEAGVETAQQFATGMSALMSDLISGTITPQIANAVCNAGGKMLKVVELQQRYGRRHADEQGGKRVLTLTE